MLSSTVRVHPTRLAILTRRFSTSAGGAENYAVQLALHLAEQYPFDYDIHVFCERSDVEDSRITIRLMGGNLRRPRWIAQWLFALWSWWQSRSGFALVHSHENTWHGNVQTAHVRPMRYSIFGTRRSPLRQALQYIKVWTSPRLLAHLALEWLRFAGGPGKRVVAVAPALADIIYRTYSVARTRLSVVAPGIAAPVTGRAAISAAQARQVFGLPAKAWVILVIGHNFEKKGLRAVLRSVPLLPSDVCVLVVGGAPAQVARWRTRCAQGALSNRVVFAGLLADASMAFAAADCHVHATLDDVFPLVVLEAFAAQVPVILSVSPYCLASDLVQAAGAACMLDNPQDEVAIASALCRLRQDGAWRAAMIGRAAQFAAQHVWPEMAKQQHQIYQQVLDYAAIRQSPTQL
jgi:UDP-glucose:(heptosyl)LPS alpha-1,3-glucosyltransferase